jgi:peptide/nickel transport system permease protein
VVRAAARAVLLCTTVMIAAASPGWSLAGAALRAGLLAAAFVVALLVWSSPADRLGGGADVGGALGTSLGPLVLGLILGAAAGVAVAVAGALADRLEAQRPETGVLLKLAGRLAGLPWLAVTPFALAVAWVLPFGLGAGSTTVLEVVVVGGVVAALVAGAAYDPLRRNDAPAAALAAAAGAGRGVLAGISALVLVETVADRPGLGRLLIEALLTRFTGGGLVAVLLVLGLVGSSLSLVGDVAPAPGVGEEEPASQRWWRLGSVATLGVPVLLLLFSFAVARDATPRFDLGSSLTPPSLLHPLGTDQLGRDLLGQLLVGYRTSLALALGATLLAVVVGGAWGALAARSGGALGDVIVAPAWVIALVPLVPALILLRFRAPSTAIAVLIGLGLLARLALAVRDLAPPDLARDALPRAAAGVFLLCLGVAFVVGTGADAIGVGTLPPTPSLGTVLGESIELAAGNVGGTIFWVAAFSVLTAGPCFFAAWSLLRPLNRGQAWGRLLA